MSNVYRKAVNLLKIRPHHSFELTKKLLIRGFSKEEIDEVIKKLTEEQLLDNESFVQNYLDELLRNKTFGFYGLKAKLMQKGMGGEEAETLLRLNLPIDDEVETAKEVLSKEEKTDKMKLAQKLKRKGFRIEVIRTALDY